VEEKTLSLLPQSGGEHQFQNDHYLDHKKGGRSVGGVTTGGNPRKGVREKGDAAGKGGKHLGKGVLEAYRSID